jgi:putative ABC transport system substrate-binding protein
MREDFTMRLSAIGVMLTLALGFLVTPLCSNAQPREKVYHIGILSLGAGPPWRIWWQLFIEAMRERHYIEGQNLVIRPTFADGNADRLQDLAADLAQAKVDVIVTTSTRETLAAKSATSTIPIVMTIAPDPVEQGLVASLARPGGNVTGLSSMSAAVSQKYVELLREVVPLASRFVVVGRLFSPPPTMRREVQAAAHRLGITVSFLTEINSPEDFDPALAHAKHDGAGGIIVALDPFTYTHRATLVQLALKHRLPGIYWVRDYVEAGGLMSYGASFGELKRRAAYFVDRILQGAKPADLPVEQPTKFELVINLKTAKALGITMPPTLLMLADEVIR